MRRVFNDVHEAIWRRLIVALMDEDRMVITVDQVIENLQTLFGRMAGDKPDEIALQLLAMPVALGPGFFLVDRDTLRGRIERRIRRTQIDLLQDIARIRGIVYAGYYGHFPLPDETGDIERPDFDLPANPVLDAIGFVPPRKRVRSGIGEDRKIERNSARDLTHTAFVGSASIPHDADVVVIGSGAGGAVAAANLADQGYKVLIIEAGPHYPSTRISTWELGMASRLFKDGAIQTTRNNDLIVFQGRVVGGSTVINNGICLRLRKDGETHPAAEDVLDTWAELGAPIDRADLDASYARIEAALNIGPIEHRLGLHNGTHMLAGWSQHLATSTDPMDRDAITGWFRKNWGAIGSGHECVSSGYCNTGCPYGRKTAAPEGHLGRATRAAVPARILCEAEAIRIEWADEDAGVRRATGVWVMLEDTGMTFVPAAKGVVVAAGTVASSTLLRKSGIARAGLAGISLNIASPVVALMPTQRNSWDEDQMATFVDRGDFLLESHFQPPMSMATLVPGWFGDHMDRMLAYNRLASAGVLVPADRLGRVVDGKLSFPLGAREVTRFRRAIALLARVHFAAGAVEVYPALLTGDPLSRAVADIDAWLADRVTEADDLVLSSSHPHGGNGISEDEQAGVVDLDQRVHGTANVLVTDASVMPSCIRVNAQLTTMAMADRVTFGRRVFG